MCNKDHLVSYLYDDMTSGERAAFEAHLRGCAECARELDALRSTRHHLRAWTPPDPELDFAIVRRRPDAPARRAWMAVPQWALSAAACLLLCAGAAAVANLDVRYGADGLVVRTGWAPSEDRTVPAPPAASVRPAAPAAGNTPTSEELGRRIDALAKQLEALQQQAVQLARVSSAPANPGITPAELRKILEETELRQRSEMALQVSQLWKDFNAVRVSDLTRMQDVVSRTQVLTNQQLRQHRDSIETLYRTASQR